MAKIRSAGGFTLVVNEDNINGVQELFDAIERNS
jgi:hypothetical protein